MTEEAGGARGSILSLGGLLSDEAQRAGLGSLLSLSAADFDEGSARERAYRARVPTIEACLDGEDSHGVVRRVDGYRSNNSSCGINQPATTIRRPCHDS